MIARLAQQYVSALSLTVDLHEFLQSKTMCSRIVTLRSRTILTINSFLAVLKHNLPLGAKSQQNNSGIIWDTLFHDTIDGTLYQSLPCRPAAQQEDSTPTEQTLAPLDRNSAEVVDPTTTLGSDNNGTFASFFLHNFHFVSSVFFILLHLFNFLHFSFFFIFLLLFIFLLSPFSFLLSPFSFLLLCRISQRVPFHHTKETLRKGTLICTLETSLLTSLSMCPQFEN